MRIPLCLGLWAAILCAQEPSPEVAALVSAGRKKLAARDFAGAEADFDKAIEKAPAISFVWLFRGQARLSLKKYTAAIKDFDKAIEVGGAKSGGYGGRAQAKAALHHYEGALSDYGQAIEANGRDISSIWRRAALRAQLQDWKGAVEDYTRMLALNPQFGAAYSGRAQAKVALEQNDSALADWEAALYLDESNPGFMQDRGRFYLQTGDLKKAKADFDRARELAPTDARAIFGHARYLQDTGEYQAALGLFKEAVRRDPKGQDYTRLFVFLMEARVGDKAKGAAALKRYAATRAEKDDWYAKVVGFLTGDLSEVAFLAAAKDDNKYVAREQLCEASWYAGAMRLAAGDKEGSKKLFEACVRTGVRNFIEYGSAAAELRRLAPR